MHLQSLELFGFKSFADKTIFEFHEGVTAIVGPNGCGKSNVLDAVRWVLGEQSAKALRGGEMADVIFNGTDNRKPVGFGEVSLTFSDCATELGVDWHDVRVTRRVYRDGNSEYLLNKTVCRLKDIQNLFADTGVGRSAYSIMEQGKIDLILSSRPEDRRTVFEEAAGITKYKTQKREALRKLEATEANLLRIGDIIKEVKRQIGSLQRQAGKARRYQTLQADLQVLDTHYSRTKLDQLVEELASCETEISRLQKSEEEAHARVEQSENDLAEKRRGLGEIDARIADARTQVQRLQSEMTGHRSRIEFNRQRADEIAELIERYRSEIAAAESKRTEQNTQIQEADALIEKTNRLLETKENELTELTHRAAELRKERAARETELQTLQLALSKAETRIAAFSDEHSGIIARRASTAARIDELAEAVTNATAARDDAQTQLNDAQTAAEADSARLHDLLGQTDAAERQLQQHRQTHAQSGTNLHAIERRIAEKDSRLEILRQLNEEGEGLAKGSQAVLQGLHDPERFGPALGGALVAQLDVAPEFVPALEAALGRNMHVVMLHDPHLLGEILETLTKNHLGHAALAIVGNTGTPETEAPGSLPDGVIAWAIEKTMAPQPLLPLVRQLLHDVVIVRDLASAWQMRENARHLQFATLTGEFVSREGIIFGGSTGAQTDSLLERKARISLLASEHAALIGQREALLAEHESHQSALEVGTQALEAARERYQTAHVAHSASGAQILLFERNLHEAERALGNLIAERNTLRHQLTSADERIGQLEQDLAAQRTSAEEQQAAQTVSEQAREMARAQEESATETLSELRLAVATERQRQENLLGQRQPMAARENELAELIAARRAEIATYENRLELQETESREAAAAIEAHAGDVKLAEESLATIAEERAARLTTVNTLESEQRRIRDSLNELHDLRGRQQVRQTQVQLRIENLSEHVARRYQLDLREFAPDHYAFQKTLRVQLKPREGSETAEPDVAQLEQIINELTLQLDNMGPVNLDAVHEYDELEERHRFLETQNNDLTAARKEVLDVITRINGTTQKLFAETFAQVRINFREMFGEMFGGGRADLSLVDENDPLNCGIEISAKPPGKQLQSISLLSGGERTMTAVALLFAIYMVRPSPFCILDEMDAPLDESNINRFIKVLDRFVEQSQFIIITHNKRTIAKADILYGVTMEERGVSKLVGMKLAAERGSDGELKRESRQNSAEQPQFPLEGAEHEPGLALSR